MEKALRALTVKELKRVMLKYGNGEELEGNSKTMLINKLSNALNNENVKISEFLEKYFEEDDDQEEEDEEKEQLRYGTNLENNVTSTDLNLLLSLPPLIIEPFRGDPSEYPKFISKFTELIVNTKITENQKLSRLIQFLEGPAKDSVKCLEGIPGGLSEALKILKERYGESYLIVHATIENITNCKQMNEYDKLGIRRMSDKLRCAFYSLKCMNKLNEINTSHMIKILSKLSPCDQIKWRDQVSKMRPNCPTFEDLVNFVEYRANCVNEPVYGNISTAKSDRDATKYKVNSHNIMLNNNKEFHSIVSCVFCKGSHKLLNCEKFIKLNIQERRSFVYDNKLCYNCLGRHHKVEECRSKVLCQKEGCNKSHHTLLHISPTTRIVSNATTKTSGSFIQIVPVRVYSPSGDSYEETFALLDTGSECSFISSGLAERLKIITTQNLTSIKLSTINGSKILNTNQASVSISALSSNEKLQISDAVVISNLNVGVKKMPSIKDYKLYDHLKDIKFPVTTAKTTELIIGCDLPQVFIAEKYVTGKPFEPIGIKTTLGWSLFGPNNNSFNKISFSTNISVINETMDELLLRRMVASEEEFSGSNLDTVVSRLDKEILDYLDNNTIVTRKGQYKIPMLWNDQKSFLLNNRTLALKRLHYLSKRLTKDNELLEKYTKAMNAYFDNHYARVVHPENTNSAKWYLPHHAVITEKKPGKVRIVFDAAAKYLGKSLNDCVHKGPDLANNMMSVLNKFRQENFAISADIESMFHRIRLFDSDRKYVRFLWWRNGIENPVVECEMLVHVFGVQCSPCIANFAIKRIATDDMLKLPAQLRNSITSNFYVDDYLISENNPETAKKSFDDIKLALSYRGFNLTKYKSNIKEELTNDVSPVLGIDWNRELDSFQFNLKVPSVPLTKRGLLSAASTIFDPLGFLAPLFIIPKMLLQELWREKIHWDAEISIENQRKWNNWCDIILSVKFISIPRCLKEPKSIISLGLHSFSDASEKAYGACVYLRTQYSDKDVKVTFICGKARVAPLKFVTIPRLELQSAVLAAKITYKVMGELDYELDGVYHWTDSTTTLNSIKNKSLKLKTYVANRITTIIDHTQSHNWYYVPTRLNPADDASRGIHISAFTENCRWLNGPSFLKQPHDEWPSQTITENIAEEALLCSNISLTTPVDLKSGMSYLINYFSCLKGLKRSIAWYKRFLMYLKDKVSCIIGPLSPEELKHAERVASAYVQEEYFINEINSLKLKGHVNNSSNLVKLHPFLDNMGIIRVGGRIKNSCLPYDQIHQVILPKHSHLSILICRHNHESNLHTSKEATICATRLRYWIVNVRSIVNKLVHNCIKCKKLDAARCKQLMGSLPASRLEAYTHPFSICGVDFFGPFYTTIFRRQLKRYGVIFICFTTKAVHIELCPTLEADDFINVFIQFSCRRGPVKEIWSDNGTNLTATEKTFRESLTNWINKEQKDITWVFNPPKASHMGGLWERAIKSIKRSLIILTNGKSYDDHRLRTMLVITENILNDRPLTAASNDPNDLECLTPNHFLLLRGSTCAQRFVSPVPSRKRWVQMQIFADHLWQRWLTEYLPLLQQRTKWLQKSKNLGIGDLVLLVNELKPRGEWPLGRIVKVYEDTSKDCLVRSVDVKTKNSVLRRPIHKLCLLESML